MSVPHPSDRYHALMLAPSHEIEEQLMKRLVEVDIASSAALLCLLAPIPQAAILRGRLFEARFLRCIQGKGQLVMNLRYLPQQSSSNEHERELRIPSPSGAGHYTSATDATVRPNRSQKTWDVLVRLESSVYMLQLTVGKKHDILYTGLDELNVQPGWGPPTTENPGYHVFVVPPATGDHWKQPQTVTVPDKAKTEKVALAAARQRCEVWQKGDIITQWVWEWNGEVVMEDEQ